MDHPVAVLTLVLPIEIQICPLFMRMMMRHIEEPRLEETGIQSFTVALAFERIETPP
jgi:hypothetical protein